VSSPAVSVAAAPAAFNPHATARAHETTITVTPTVAGTATTTVESSAGVIVATLSVNAPTTPAAALAYSWDGGGAADGDYAIHVALTDAAGVISEAIAPVAIDSTPPKVVFPPAQPSATKQGPVTVRASTADPTGAAAMTLSVSNQLDDLLGTVRVPLAADSTSGSLAWNLRLRRRLLLPGVYHLRVAVTDGAGNTGESTMRLVRVQRPVQAKIIYSLPDAGNVIGLSFDDCVSQRDMLAIINAFKAAKAHTTFFCNGVNVRSNQSAARAALAAGDTIGSHTWSHPQLPTLSYGEQASQIQGDIDVWWQVARAAPTPFFRPPYGLHNNATLQAAGAEGFRWVILWDVDPSDYLDPPPSVLVDHVVTHARRGSIVVMHVNANTASAVPALIRAVRAKGLEPKSMDELFGSAAYLSPASG
ncbi:MAG: polysaccharide deacetylase family protein, partial [Gaiellales bacterium]